MQWTRVHKAARHDASEGLPMRRFLVFGLLGPCVGLIVYFSLGAGMEIFTLDFLLKLPGLFLFLPFAFYIGFVPALVTAICDAALNRWGVRPLTRYALTGVVGYVSSYMIFLRDLPSVPRFDAFLVIWGLIGLISAVICAWLNDRAGLIRAAEARFDTRNPEERPTPSSQG
jgi:hypothetical protein